MSLMRKEKQMNLFSDLFKGMILLSTLAILQHGCTVGQIAKKASSAHTEGLSSYGSYSRILTGKQQSWLD